jgi:multiple sugar transport system permease protein
MISNSDTLLGSSGPIGDVGRERRGRGRRRQLISAAIMLFPLVALLGGLLGWPIVWTILLAFKNTQLTGPTALHPQWIGLTNFRNLISDPDFTGSLEHSLIYLFGSAYLGQVVLGFLLALLLRRCSGSVQRLVGGIIILSWIVPEIIASFMWFALLGVGGVLQQFLGYFGISYNPLLVSHPLLALNIANSWRGVAFSFMLFTAAIAGIPSDVIEAAELDGASPWRRVRHIFLPFIKGSILIDVVLVTLATLNDFVLIFALTGGGPGEASQVLSTYMYLTGFSEYQIAYGASVSVVLLVVGVALSLVYIRVLRKT